VLDSSNDERRAYELFCTPLGVQIDAINDDVSENYDDSWNAIWGFDAIRSYPRDFRHHIGAFARDRAKNSYLSQTIKLKGMTGASPGHNLELIPTITASRSDARESLDAPNFTNGDVDADVGLSVRWGIFPNMSLNGAIHPDFSQVEADALQLAENEQFALYFRETRPFFLEGADYFSTDLRLVHTRAIAKPSGAGQPTGKQGKHTWAVFTARDGVTNLIVPGLESSASGQFDVDNTSSAARYRMDFGPNSFAGVTVTDRRAEDYSNSVFSADTVYRWTQKDKFNASAAISNTEYSNEMISQLGASEGSVSDPAVYLAYNHSERGWWFFSELNQLGTDYRSDLGFQPNVGLRSVWAGGAKVWWGEDGDMIQRKAWGSSYSRGDPVDGGMLEESFDTWANANLPWQTYIDARASTGRRWFDGEMFDIWDLGAGVESQLTGDLSLSFDGRMGDWIDFANSRRGQRHVLNSSLGYTFGRHLNLQLSHIFSAMNVGGERLFTIHAPQLRAVHQFNSRAFVRLILQYTGVNRDPSLYADAVDDETQSLLTQLLFTYKVNPKTALYAGYGDNQFGDDEFGLTHTDRAFFMELGYAWVR